MSFWRIEHEAEGVEGFLGKIRQELKDKTYKASPVKRVYIEKADGKLRPLGCTFTSTEKVKEAMF